MTYYGDMNLCEVDGCSGRVKGLSLCENHLKKYRRGTLDTSGLSLAARKLSTAEEVIERRVDTSSGHCWIWTGAKAGTGYGALRWEGSVHPAHRWLYERIVGPIPDGLDLDHQCHNVDLTCEGGPSCAHRACVNPNHLVPSTRAENLLRGNGNGGRREVLA